MSGLHRNDPEPLTEARETEDLAAAANAWRTPQLLLIHILRVKASKGPGGLISWGWTDRAGLCCVCKCSLAHSCERPSSVSTPSCPWALSPLSKRLSISGRRVQSERPGGLLRRGWREVAMCAFAPGRHPPTPSSNIPGSSLLADYHFLNVRWQLGLSVCLTPWFRREGFCFATIIQYRNVKIGSPNKGKNKDFYCRRRGNKVARFQKQYKGRNLRLYIYLHNQENQ